MGWAGHRSRRALAVRPLSGSLAFALVLTASAAAAGCAKRPAATQPPPALEAIPAEARDPNQGQVGYEFLLDATAAQQLGPDKQLWSPQPDGPLAPPVYPERPLQAGAAPATVVVRIIIGVDGRVLDVKDSPKMASTPGPFLEDFRRATEEAVRAWSFRGGRVATVIEGGDIDGDGKSDYKEVASWQPVQVYYDVRFDFAIVDGKGHVTGGIPPLP